MPFCRVINFTHVDCDFNKYRGKAETVGHHHSCLYLDEEDMELNSEDDFEVIKKEEKKVTSDKEPLSSMPGSFSRSTRPPLPMSI